MESSNIDKFDQIAGRTFALLYESFPTPRPLLPKDFLDDNLTVEHDFMGEIPSPESIFVLDSLTWLLNSGFISAARHNSGLSNAVLTVRGLEVLKQRPHSVSPSEPEITLGTRLMKAVKTGSGKMVSTAVNQALSIGVSVLLKQHGFSE